MMATATWEDFTDKYGFSDGEAVENQDFRARRHLARLLNGLPEMKGVRALEFDRPGVHNPCLIVLVPNQEGRSPRRLMADWKADRVGTCNLPEAVEEKIHDLVAQAYIMARRRR